MTDLERVRKEDVIRAALKRLEARDNGVDDYVARNGLDALDAHLKEDAEREAKLLAMQTMALSTGHYTADQELLVAKLTELREAASALLDATDTVCYDGFKMWPTWDRLHQLIEEKP